MKPMSLRAALLSTALLPIFAAADTAVLIHVDVKNAPASRDVRCLTAGDYTFRTASHKVRADLPDGSAIVFDFDKRTVVTLDPNQKTYCQYKMGDFLALGERVSPGIARNF